MQIRYADGPRLRRSLLATTEYARGARPEPKRINVFSAPDGDAGTNPVLTVRRPPWRPSTWGPVRGRWPTWAMAYMVEEVIE
ncbi:MAG: hypothetical protein ACOC8K_00745 [Gemmatimonadota bacterium]